MRSVRQLRTDLWTVMILCISAAVFFCFVLQNEEARISSSSSHVTHNHLTSLIGFDCPCRSLFSIGVCGVDDLIQNNPGDWNWKETLREIELASKGLQISVIQKLKYLSRYFPDYFSFTFTQPINRLNFKLPYVPCRIHIYNESEITTCIKKRQELTGRKLKIAFVGDSLVRNLMERIVVHLRIPLNLTAAGEFGLNLTTLFLDHKLKHMFPAVGEGLELRLHWSSELSKVSEKDQTSSKTVLQGARDILEAWANNTSSTGAVPDIIYLDEGMWSSVIYPNIHAFDDVQNGMKTILPILKTLSHSSLLLFRATTPTKGYLTISKRPNNVLDLVDQYIRNVLRESGVWVWDSAIPVYLKEFQECRNFWRATRGNKTALPKDWACMDYQHPSKVAEAVAENMLWNLVCNRLMKVDSDNCCS